MIRGVLVLAAGIVLTGCAAPQSRYEWGSYEEVVYASYLSHDDVPAEKQVELLEKDYQTARSTNRRMPPGWHAHLGYVTLAWVLGLALLFGVAIYDPSIAAGIARVSLALTATSGILLIVYLGFNRYDRAILLVPAWVLIMVWLFGAWMTITGKLDNDIIQPALGGGLVLIVLLIGFTVMQHAFAGGAAACTREAGQARGDEIAGETIIAAATRCDADGAGVNSGFDVGHCPSRQRAVGIERFGPHHRPGRSYH